MKIAFFCSPENGGSPSFAFLPPDVDGYGVGGAELALIRLTRELARMGHEVTVWNDPTPRSQSNEPSAIMGSAYDTDYYDGVRYLDADTFFPEDHHYDVFVLFRNPYSCVGCVNADLKIWWSTDQQTCGDYRTDILPFVDLTICISPYHRQYHIDRYGADPDKIISIDLGVDVDEYAALADTIKKVPNRLLYASVPSRGLEYLPALFYEISLELSHLRPAPELYITADTSLWGKGIGAGNERYKAMFDGLDNVHFVGKLPRRQLVELQMSSDILAYPNAPDGRFAELFCVSVAEAQVAGCLPVTSAFGALATTVIDDAFVVSNKDGTPLHPGDDTYYGQFIETICDLLKNRPELGLLQKEISQKAIARFAYPNIARQWLTTIYAHK